MQVESQEAEDRQGQRRDRRSSTGLPTPTWGWQVETINNPQISVGLVHICLTWERPRSLQSTGQPATYLAGQDCTAHQGIVVVFRLLFKGRSL